MFKNYLKVAVRNIIKHKGYSFISISGLTLGMACCIFIFLWVQDELNFDRFHKDADNIYRVIVEYPGGISSNSPLAMAPYMKRNYPEVTKTTRLRIRQYPLKYADTNSYEIGLMVDADFFRIFSFPFIKGNPQNAFPDDKSIVISQKIAYKFFGNKDPLGKILRYMNNYDLTVTGIIENVDSNFRLL